MSDIVGGLQLALGTVLAVAAVSKLRPTSAQDPLFALLGLRAVRMTRMILAAVELSLATALFLNVAPPRPALAVSAMLLVFTGVLAYAVSRGVNAPCRCFGSFDQLPVGAVAIARNLTLTAAAVVVALRPLAAGDVLLIGPRIALGAAVLLLVFALYTMGSTVDGFFRSLRNAEEATH